MERLGDILDSALCFPYLSYYCHHSMCFLPIFIPSYSSLRVSYCACVSIGGVVWRCVTPPYSSRCVSYCACVSIGGVVWRCVTDREFLWRCAEGSDSEGRGRGRTGNLEKKLWQTLFPCNIVRLACQASRDSSVGRASD